MVQSSTQLMTYNLLFWFRVLLEILSFIAVGTIVYKVAKGVTPNLETIGGRWPVSLFIALFAILSRTEFTFRRFDAIVLDDSFDLTRVLAIAGILLAFYFWLFAYAVVALAIQRVVLVVFKWGTRLS
ncbi:MAG: hypothetical protein U0Q18_16120 [Bryobacteraceae bacterium]